METAVAETTFAIRWAGAAGDGLQSTGLFMAKYLNRLGYHVHGTPGNQSAIRGGQLWYQIDISSKKIPNSDNVLDMIVLLNPLSLKHHINELRENGILLYNDNGRVSIEEFKSQLEAKSINVLGIPLTKMAREIDPKKPVLGNTVAVGSILEILQLDPEDYKKSLEKGFPTRPDIVQMNVEALQKGSAYAREHLQMKVALLPPTLEKGIGIIVNGNHAIALGAAAAGLKFLSQYPITPASSILTYLSLHAEQLGIVVRQVEDEIAAVTQAIGAGWAGVRAMTATSGPGISLMAENIGLAGITETPIVIIDSMRGGPSTGMPTKAEQSDLLSIIHVSHGEFPRAVLAPRTIEEAYNQTVRAFNIAEKYQIPVFVLVDFQLSERIENVPPFNLEVEIDRGKLLDSEKRYPNYRRYEYTEDGISPRLLAPHPDGIHVAVGAEHDPESNSLAGYAAGLLSARIAKEKMFEKRFKKQQMLEENDMQPPKWHGVADADYTLVCWGSITPAVEDAVNYLNINTAGSFNVLSFSDMFPLPVAKIKSELAKINTGIIIEVNYTGQLEQLLRLYLDWNPDAYIRHIEGEILTKTRIIQYLKAVKLNNTQFTPYSETKSLLQEDA